jgi:hypothetical protein
MLTRVLTPMLTRVLIPVPTLVPMAVQKLKMLTQLLARARHGRFAWCLHHHCSHRLPTVGALAAAVSLPGVPAVAARALPPPAAFEARQPKRERADGSLDYPVACSACLFCVVG